ncbi:ECF-type sigma factor [soil metagenome]
MPRSTDDEGSVTRWIDELKAGDPAAAQPLWERYFDRLVRLARRRLVSSRRTGADEDEEDAALSAFDSFCAGAARGRFPMLADREDLWRLLVVITARKASAQIDRRSAQKRGGDWSRLDAPAPDRDDLAGFEVDQLADGGPTPEFAAMVAEQYRRLLEALGDDGLRQVALWRMEGLTTDEIAEQLGCARRTVARRLELIRKIWLEDSP